jgi:tRNA threonylcarbamoyladenosine biosynthesis protein TsaE
MMIRKSPMGNHTIIIQNLYQLNVFAGLFGKSVCPGDFVALTGTLGAGKTTFARFFCESLGIIQPLTSPTFTLLNEYDGKRFHVLHGDFYRLTDREIEAMLPDLEECFEQSNAVILMEWADKAPQLEYRWAWQLHFATDPMQEASRTLTISAVHPEKLQALITEMEHGL